MRKPFFPVILFLLFVVVFDRQSAVADCRSFFDLIDNGGYAVADHTGQIVSSCNENTSFIPASIIKVPLALAAFDILKPDFRFTTELYVDSQDNLYVKGHGDPFLISEEIVLILDQLVRKGVQVINGIFIDDSAFNLSEQAPGRGMSDNPYDVPVSSVVVNFNTVHIKVNNNGSVESAEPQTPTLPIMKELGKNLQPGKYRLNVCQEDCSPELQSARYTTELFRALQKKRGMIGTGALEKKIVPASASLIYIHNNTRNLQDVVLSSLKYSNNLITNQIFLRCGVEQFGWPATWGKAKKAVGQSLTRILGSETVGQIYMEDGAGLSRKNLITANVMLKVLDEFRPYVHLMQEKKNASIKSGTLNRVYNYAGYLADGKSFVILLNQKRNTRDKVLERLRKNQ
jgi:D-alanyl-D-alanine carboxypeptidase/D-alanyl-D-alanine-endopeptidase (penicillin-binding protein 4)